MECFITRYPQCRKFCLLKECFKKIINTVQFLIFFNFKSYDCVDLLCILHFIIMWMTFKCMCLCFLKLIYQMYIILFTSCLKLLNLNGFMVVSICFVFLSWCGAGNFKYLIRFIIFEVVTLDVTLYYVNWHLCKFHLNYYGLWYNILFCWFCFLFCFNLNVLYGYWALLKMCFVE